MIEQDINELDGDEKIIAEAKQRFDRCKEYYSTFQARFIEDIKFANADSDNCYQWEENLQQSRVNSGRPVVTINKVRANNNLIINDAKQNKASIKIRATGGGASVEAAQVYEDIIRHIQYISNADDAYDHAIKMQVDGGKGFWRVLTDYADNDTFDQDIFIKRISNSLSVYEDPDAKEKDASDSKFYFIFEDVLKDDFEHDYPQFKNQTPVITLNNNDSWINDKHIRIAEYYRISNKKDVLISYTDSEGLKTAKRSELPLEVYRALKETQGTETRPIKSNVVEWYKIAGDKIVDRRVGKDAWKCKYIPIVKVTGSETVIEGKYDCKGHTRTQKDSQRMYNYNSAASIEYGALQTKAPWIAPAQAIEGYTQYWEDANVKNFSVLPYNHVDDDGQPIPPPQRIAPPQGASFYVEERQACANDLMYVTGQYEAATGQYKPEQSGKAINERQRQTDTANYHYTDNQAIGIRFTGKMLLDLIPHIIDTKRALKMRAKDGSEMLVIIDPNAKQAYQQQQEAEEGKISVIFNPNIGKYDIEADVGPSYATKRQETFNAFTQILSGNHELVPLLGDLWVKNADFDGAEEASQRLKNMIPPQALGKEGANPQLQAAQEQIQKMSKMLETTLQQLAEQKLKMTAKEQQKEIDVYDSITKRLETVFKHVVVTPKEQAQMAHDILKQEHQSNLDIVTATANQQLQGTQDEEQSSMPQTA